MALETRTFWATVEPISTSAGTAMCRSSGYAPYEGEATELVRDRDASAHPGAP